MLSFTPEQSTDLDNFERLCTRIYNNALDAAAKVCYNYKDRIVYDLNDPSKASNFDECAKAILRMKQ